MDWIGSEPLSVADLRGRVVLLRFWTDTCPFCRASAPALKQLDEEYRDRGLTVVGLHHGKPRGTAVERERVESIIDKWGWKFPVGLDASWAALDRYWLNATPFPSSSTNS